MNSRFIFYIFGIFLVSQFTSADQCGCNATYNGFDDRVECMLNKQIAVEYQAFYVYENLASYFQRPSVGLLGFSKFFRKAADEEIGHARQMIEFLNSLKKKVKFQSLRLKDEDTLSEPTSARSAILKAISKENDVYRNIRCVHKFAESPAVHVFLDDFIMEQVKSISDLTVMNSRLSKESEPGIVEFLVDKELQ